MSIKVAIIEDDIQIGEWLKSIVDSCDEFYCYEVYEDAESFIEKFRHLEIDVVVMDIGLPGYSGIDCVEKLKAIKPKVEFLMCTVFEDDDNILSALSVGAMGYIIKNNASEKLIEGIKEIHAGFSPMSSQIARKIINLIALDKKNSVLLKSLTKREREVLELLAKGYPYKQVADNLLIKIDTVRTYIRDIYSKLQVSNKTEAINMLYPKIKGRE